MQWGSVRLTFARVGGRAVSVHANKTTSFLARVKGSDARSDDSGLQMFWVRNCDPPGLKESQHRGILASASDTDQCCAARAWCCKTWPGVVREAL